MDYIFYWSLSVKLQSYKHYNVEGMFISEQQSESPEHCSIGGKGACECDN